VDTNAQDLEEANRKLRSQSTSDKEIMAGLTSSLEQSETRCERLEEQLEAFKKEMKSKEISSSTNAAVKQVFALFEIVFVVT
jgi:predicted RNase H-like nuclease (RuvC/YqgF family)